MRELLEKLQRLALMRNVEPEREDISNAAADMSIVALPKQS